MLMITTGCAADQANGAGIDPDVAAAFDRRASEIASAWAESGATAEWRAGFRPLAPLTVLPAQPMSDEVAQALSTGWLRKTSPLSGQPQRDGEVRFENGETQPVALIPPLEAWEAVHEGSVGCPEQPAEPSSVSTGPDWTTGEQDRCPVLTVTGVRAGTVPIATSRGPAEVPAWLFDVDGLDEPLARVAVAPTAIADPMRLSGIDSGYLEGLAPALWLDAVDETQVTYQVGIGACDLQPLPLVYETTALVVIGGTAQEAPGITGCTDQEVPAELTVTLDAPVGTRPLLASNGEVLTFTPW
jgi:hypothetical protein